MMRILALETSCDDLSCALLETPRQVLSSCTASQVSIHERFGGIVPEVASREHLKAVSQVVQKVLGDAPEEKKAFQAIAVTCKPGLVGSLLVGLNFAKGLALAARVPFIGINHLEGHLFSPFLEQEKITFPFLGLVISGGHTNLYFVEGFAKYQCLGVSVDDALGEAYDKVAKALGLSYPGGPILDRLAAKGNPLRFRFTLPQVKRGKYFTSFSGLKTAVLEEIRAHRLEQIAQRQSIEESQPALDLIASFQNTTTKIVERLLIQASEDFQCARWALSGGVACNSAIRKRLGQVAEQKKMELLIPTPKFCTDNAAMIGFVAAGYLERGVSSALSLNAQASLEWENH